MRMRCLLGLWLAAMLCISSLGAAVNDAPLADAVERRDNQAVLSLLKTRADVNAAQSDGATALHWAAYLDDAETASLLIRAGARVDTPNNYGVTPLALASGNGNAAIIDQLLKAGADPNGVGRADPLEDLARSELPESVRGPPVGHLQNLVDPAAGDPSIRLCPTTRPGPGPTGRPAGRSGRPA